VQAGYSFALSNKGTQLICTMPDGRRVVGKFTLRDGRVGSIDAQIVGK
jgi:hypothetical protein